MAEPNPQLLLGLPLPAMDLVCKQLTLMGTNTKKLKPLYCTCKAMQDSPVLGAQLTNLKWPKGRLFHPTSAQPSHRHVTWLPEWTTELRQQLMQWPACVPSLETLEMGIRSPRSMVALAQLATEGQPRVLQLLAGMTKLEVKLSAPMSAAAAAANSGAINKHLAKLLPHMPLIQKLTVRSLASARLPPLLLLLPQLQALDVWLAPLPAQPPPAAPQPSIWHGLASMAHLIKLSLHGFDNVLRTPEHVQQISQLAALTQLRELKVNCEACFQAVLDACAQLTGLTKLGINVSRYMAHHIYVPALDWAALVPLSNLESLCILSQAPSVPGSLQQLLASPQLNGLCNPKTFYLGYICEITLLDIAWGVLEIGALRLSSAPELCRINWSVFSWKDPDGHLGHCWTVPCASSPAEQQLLFTELREAATEIGQLSSGKLDLMTLRYSLKDDHRGRFPLIAHKLSVAELKAAVPEALHPLVASGVELLDRTILPYSRSANFLALLNRMR